MLQQLAGVINLSLPLIALYYTYPPLFDTYIGIGLCAVFIGIVCYLLNWYSTKNMIRALKYAPSDRHKTQLEELVNHCDMQSSQIQILYAYTTEQVALTAFNTIILDPVVWSSIAADPEAIKVMDIFERFTLPTLSPTQKQRLEEVKKILSPDAQTFILKHELAHVYHGFSAKKLVIHGLIGFVAAYISILAAMSVIYKSGFIAVWIGIIVGCIADLTCTFLSNALFKVQEEKNADLFAAHYSSAQEVAAAADFFEKHQHIVNTYKEPRDFLFFLPSIFRTGHPDGTTRAAYLRSLITK